MRAIVKGQLGIFTPQGFLDGNNAPALFTIEDIKATQALNVKMLLVSLKKVVFFNKNGLHSILNVLLKFRNQKHISIGFCDYDTNKYQTILAFYKGELNFSLFRSQKIAELFVTSMKEESKNVLIYHDDPSQRSSMAIELFEHGHNPIVAQSQKEFLEKKQTKDQYYAIVEDSFLGLFGGQVATRVTGNAIIYTLGTYLDAEIGNSFDITYHTNSLLVGFRLFIFDAHKVVSMNVHALNFFTRLATSAAEYNANICFVGLTFEKTPIKFKEDMEDAGIIFFDTLDDILLDKEMLDSLGASSAALTQNKRSINKNIITKLPLFIDATVSTMQMMTNSEATKESANLQTLQPNIKGDAYASSIGFYGDLDGMIVLIFPEGIAQKSCEILLGESTSDKELILDSLAEFVNIIGGRVKTILSESHTKVDITLPRTYEKVSNILEVIEGKKGVQVDMKFAGDNFIFFLTR